MDVFESRRPSVRAEKSHGMSTTTTTRRSKTREVSSRYKSPSPSPSTSNSRRFPSPNSIRININGNVNVNGSSKRAVSAERKRPSTPPSTPVLDTSLDSSKKISSRLPEVLWPSTMRSLIVSFQSDSVSIPVGKKEKPVSYNTLSDRTLKPSSNVVHRKPTPERKRSPLKGGGKNPSHQSENSRPVDGAQARLIDQHRWPSRTGGSMLTKSVDFSDKNGKNHGLPHRHPISGRRLSIDGVQRPLHKTSSDFSQQLEIADNISSLRALGVDSERSRSLPRSRLPSPSRGPVGPVCRPSTPTQSRGISPLKNSRPATPTQSRGISPLKNRPATPTQSRGISPLKNRPATPTQSRGISPLTNRPSTPTQSRGTSPSRIRQSSPTRPSTPTQSASVLSFVADIKKGKKTNQLEDAHQLRLLYNRQLQWLFANALADASLFVQKIMTEQTLYNVLETNMELWDSVLRKRIELQRLNTNLKLNLVLKEQMVYLEEWALLDEDHSSSLNGAIEDLEASTLRLPVTGGAKADIDSLKIAMSSAADVMQMMGSSICSLLSKGEGMNGLVSELADLAGHERATLNECDTLLSSSSAMQVKEYSLRTQLIQSQQNLANTRLSLFWTTS